MGEIAEMMLDGEMCAGCGEWLGESYGFPQYCSFCHGDDEPKIFDGELRSTKKIPCDICGKRVHKGNGLRQHIRDKHPETTTN